jgi:hypothetical protein
MKWHASILLAVLHCGALPATAQHAGDMLIAAAADGGGICAGKPCWEHTKKHDGGKFKDQDG